MKKIAKICIWCEKLFDAPIKEVNRGKGNTCSISCANAKRSADRKIPGARKAWIEANKNTESYKKKRKAHHLIEQEIKSGRLTRGVCEICGTNKAVHAHHDDYEKPLCVRWLCVAHHRAHHH